MCFLNISEAVGALWKSNLVIFESTDVVEAILSGDLYMLSIHKLCFLAKMLVIHKFQEGFMGTKR